MLERSDFARLRGAVLGGVAGAIVAIILANLLTSTGSGAFSVTPQGILPWAAGWSSEEGREKLFYVLTILLGGAGAFLGAQLSSPRPLGWPAIVSPLLITPLLNDTISRFLVSDPNAIWSLAVTVIVWFALLLLPRLLGAHAGWPEANDAEKTQPDAVSMSRGPVANVAIAVVAVAIICVALIPASPLAVAQAIGFDMHTASFMIGPATYAFAPGLLPGIDYFTQYSIGTPWLFHFFLSPDATTTVANAVSFVAAEMILFEVTLFFFLWWLFRSWGWAIFLTLAILLMQFTTPDALYAPSSTAARYPLMMVVALTFVWWIRRNLSFGVALLLGAAIAGSVFLNTETGFYAGAAVTVAALAVTPRRLRAIAMLAVVGVATVLSFMVLNVVAFGTGVFSIAYLAALTAPLRLYGSGLGAAAIQWLPGLSWLYNIVLPGLAIATVGWAMANASRTTDASERARLGGLVVAATIALLMSAKFINQSLIALWLVNAFGFLIVAAWWLREGLRVFVRSQGEARAARLRTAAIAVMAAGLASWLVFLRDDRNPSDYAYQSYRLYPSLLNSVVGVPAHACGARTGCASHPPAALDIELIQKTTQPSDRIVLFGLYDWVYLVAAERASHFAFLPSAVIFTEEQLKESLRDLDKVDVMFLPKEPADLRGITHDNVREILGPILDKEFLPIAWGTDLVVWKRFAPHAG